MVLVLLVADFSGGLVALEKLQRLQPYNALVQLLDLSPQVVATDAVTEAVGVADVEQTVDLVTEVCSSTNSWRGEGFV